MHDETIRWHIVRVATGDDRIERRLSAGRARFWPGGPADRTQPAARQWLRLWHPARAAAALPVCSCAAGRCPVCN